MKSEHQKIIHSDEHSEPLEDIAGGLLSEARSSGAAGMAIPSGKKRLDFEQKQWLSEKKAGIFVTDQATSETHFVPEHKAKPFIEKLSPDTQIEYRSFDFENGIFEIEIDNDGEAALVPVAYSHDPFA